MFGFMVRYVMNGRSQHFENYLAIFSLVAIFSFTVLNSCLANDEAEAGANLQSLETIVHTSQNKPLVSDEFTGVAIYGFDPVHYFTDGTPEKGIGLFEYAWKGGYWWFINIRNRDIFSRSPDVYAPVYGGYDPVELSRGHLVAGDPHFFLIHDKRLYLFAKQRNIKPFTKAPDDVIDKAGVQWAKANELHN